MADLYDEQFKRRVEMHLLLCDPVSADIISALQRYVENFNSERDEARAVSIPVRTKKGMARKLDSVSGRGDSFYGRFGVRKIVARNSQQKPAVTCINL